MNSIDIDDFIYPTAETLVDDEGDITTILVERYGIEIEESDDSEPEIVLLKVTAAEAIQALDILKAYELQHSDGDIFNMRALNTILQSVNSRRRKHARQQQIQAYFHCK